MCLFATACSDDNNGNEPITPFSLDKTYYEVRLERGSTTIHVTNGSGDISLSIEDEKTLNAKYQGGLYADDLRGVIYLYGLQKGSTTLTITDNVTKDVETVEVKVTDCYLAYVINDSNHPVLPAGTTLFLVNNQAQDYYLFDQDNIYNKPILKDNNYEFSSRWMPAQVQHPPTTLFPTYAYTCTIPLILEQPQRSSTILK